MTTEWRHPADKALNVIPASIRNRNGRDVGFDKDNTYLKDYSRDGTVFRKLLRASCHLRDPVQEMLYPNYQRKHKHHQGGTCKDMELMPKPVPLLCCPTHKTEAEGILKEHKKYLIFSPRPQGPDPIRNKYPDRFEKHVQQTIRENEQRQFPLSTVLLRWHSSITDSNIGYETDNLHTIMNSYGPVRSVAKTGHESAVAVFESITDCCHLLERPLIHYWYGNQEFHLCCSWYHRSLEARAFFKSGGKIKSVMNEFLDS